MTPKETAKELIQKVYDLDKHNKTSLERCKNISLLIIDENIKMLKEVLDKSTDIYQSITTPKKLCIDILNPSLKYWQEVKEEIQKL